MSLEIMTDVDLNQNAVRNIPDNVETVSGKRMHALDAEMSSESENPVQNKAIKAALDALDTKIDGKTVNVDGLSVMKNTVNNNEVLYAVGYRNIVNNVAKGESFNVSFGGRVPPAGSLTATGLQSHAEGNHPTADGDYSHAEGYYGTATGTASHAEGNTTVATGNYSHTEGRQVTAYGEASHAEGYGEGVYQSAMGTNAESLYNIAGSVHFSLALTEGSHVEGKSTAALGFTSHAEGYRTRALGSYSHTEGSETSVSDVSATGSHAEGCDTDVCGSFAHAEGSYTRAVGNGAHAEGRGSNTIPAKSIDSMGTTVIVPIWATANDNLNVAYGNDSHSEGNGCCATGDQSHAEGYESLAYGKDSHCEGYQCIAYGNHSHAEGSCSNKYNFISIGTEDETIIAYFRSHPISMAKGNSSHVEGMNNIALNDYAHAEGYNNIAKGVYTHVEGYNNSTLSDYSHAEGSSNSIATNAAHSHVEGDANTLASGAWRSHAEGYGNSASGDVSHVEGYENNVSGSYSHGEGYHTITSGVSAHSEGYNTTTIGNHSHSEGYSYEKYSEFRDGTEDEDILVSFGTNHFSLAKGIASHVEGYGNLTLGYDSHSEGKFNSSVGDHSHAEGFENSAVADCSHVEGWSNIASGAYSHAEGFATEAAGNGAHVEGFNNKALGPCSHVEGSYNTARGECTHVEGYHNEIETRTSGENNAVISGAHISGAFNIVRGGDNNKALSQGGVFISGSMNETHANGAYAGFAAGQGHQIGDSAFAIGTNLVAFDGCGAVGNWNRRAELVSHTHSVEMTYTTSGDGFGRNKITIKKDSQNNVESLIILLNGLTTDGWMDPDDIGSLKVNGVSVPSGNYSVSMSPTGVQNYTSIGVYYLIITTDSWFTPDPDDEYTVKIKYTSALLGDPNIFVIGNGLYAKEEDCNDWHEANAMAVRYDGTVRIQNDVTFKYKDGNTKYRISIQKLIDEIRTLIPTFDLSHIAVSETDDDWPI